MEIINFEDAKARKQLNLKLQSIYQRQMIAYQNYRGNTGSTPSFVTNGIMIM